jgi:hypothetical protein
MWRKISYNKRSAKKHGWDPTWFEASDFDEQLINNIELFQAEHGLSIDGKCGPVTFRHIFTQREAQEVESATNNHIICDGEKVPISWDKVVDLYAADNYALSEGHKKYAKNKRKVSMIVTHFDVCLSAASCKRVLEKKGISSHFVIDNDGTICQMVDPQHEGWHAGNRKVNKASIGIDLSNGVYTKYQKWYRRKGFSARPLLTDVKVHGATIKECLGFYPVQIEAYKVLVKTLCRYYDIPLEMPLADDGTVLRAVHSDSVKAKFEGIVNHFHLTRNKWDTANLDWDAVLEELVS